MWDERQGTALAQQLRMAAKTAAAQRDACEFHPPRKRNTCDERDAGAEDKEVEGQLKRARQRQPALRAPGPGGLELRRGWGRSGVITPPSIRPPQSCSQGHTAQGTAQRARNTCTKRPNRVLRNQTIFYCGETYFIWMVLTI